VITQSIPDPQSVQSVVHSVYLALEQHGNAFPIARLDRRAGRYTFRYTSGALQLGSAARVLPLPTFPKLTQRYESRELFPAFAALIPEPASARRAEFAIARGFDPGESDEMALLSVPTPLDAAGTVKTLPNLRGNENGRFDFRVFLRGPGADSPLAKTLRPGQPLWTNLLVADGGRSMNVMIVNERQELIDYLPPLVSQEISAVLGSGFRPTLEIVRINEPPHPAEQRLLVHIRGQWPARYEPMQRVAFAPILI
jgi:hypothetical protein